MICYASMRAAQSAPRHVDAARQREAVICAIRWRVVSDIDALPLMPRHATCHDDAALLMLPLPPPTGAISLSLLCRRYRHRYA